MSGFSVRTKVFLLFAGAALLTVVPVLVLISRAVEDRVYERASRELVTSSDALSTYWNAQDELLRESARRVARERGVARLLATGDTARLRYALSRQVGPGRVVLAADTAGNPLVGAKLDSMTLNGGGSIVIVSDDGRPPLRVAVWPVFADTSVSESPDSLDPMEMDSVRVGIIGVGKWLDEESIRQLKELTGGEVALVVGDSTMATTLPDSLSAVLADLNLAAMLRQRAIWRPQVDKLPYLLLANALTTAGPPTGVLLLRSVAEELRIARGIKRSVAYIGALALVLALLLALVVSRIVARPAQALAAAAGDLARGNYDAPLPRASGDEIGQLTTAFGEMRAAIGKREKRLRSAQAELIHREKLAAMGRLVGQLSHEINNPIYNIQNCLEVLERRGDPTDPNREFLDLAREELDRMAVLTRQLLDQSRPLADAARPLDVNVLVKRVTTLAAPDLASHGISVELDLNENIPTVVAHPDGIQQVLVNLVDNAIDAMPAGGTLDIATRLDRDAIEVVVQDTGAGIADEHLPHVFDAFFTTKPGVRGVGLGLFVSEGIIRGHRGRLLVESRPGEGSRFIVRLPRETLDAALAESAAPTPDEPAVA